MNLWPNLTGGEAIDVLGGCAAGSTPTRRAALLDRFELDPAKKGRTYSKGNRQKVALVAALAADVELLILDEPTSGLDPLMEAVFRGCVDESAEPRARPCCCRATSSPRSRRSATASRIIRAGRAVETGTLAELRHLTRTSIVAETASPPTGLDALARRPRPRGRGRPRRASTSTRPTSTRRCGSSPRSASAAWSSQPPTLEELFLRHYGDDLDGASPDGAAARGAAR